MRKLKMKKTTTKPIKRKCHNCGKMATKPYVYHIVPAFSYGAEIPVYQKSALKTNRIELRGNRKVLVYNYCNNWINKEEEDSSGLISKYNECYENKKAIEPLGF
jgi:hypothetical protein